MLNYLDLNLAAAIIYSTFMVVWSYFRIYLSALTIYSVYKHYTLIPAYARTFYPSQGHWLVWWMQCHVCPNLSHSRCLRPSSFFFF